MALIECYECEREISDSAVSCPGCGAPVRAKRRKKGNTVPYTAQEVAVLLSKKRKTSHLLHLLLSIITGGVWIIVWILLAISHSSENARIDRKIRRGKKI
ncbi:MAG TPA: hypothetical protein VFA86_07100 [Gammaproteobacteria bacterium]|nr:hypothetical protein [Gammaproteobacteria bacterium]